MKTFIVSLTMFCYVASMAETPRQIITAMNKAYLQLNSYSVQFNYKLYTDGKAQYPIETAIGQLSRTTDCYYYKMEDMEYMRNSKYMVAVDHSKRLVILNKSSVQAKTPLAFVDSVMLNYGFAIKEITDTKDAYHYILTPPSSEMEEYERVDLYISRRDRDVQRVVLYLVEQPEGETQADLNGKTIELKKPRIEIEYQHLAKNVSLSPALFSESKFLAPDKTGKLKLIPRYSSYKLFNQL